jgi:hypothetical protein
MAGPYHHTYDRGCESEIIMAEARGNVAFGLLFEKGEMK